MGRRLEILGMAWWRWTARTACVGVVEEEDGSERRRTGREEEDGGDDPYALD